MIAGLLFRAWHFRRLFRAEVIHARLTGAPEPVYRNPFLGGRWAPESPSGELMEVPTLWDEEMCLEPTLPYTPYPEKSKLGTGTMDEEGGWGKGKAVVRPASDGSERTLWEEQLEKRKEDWGLDKVQPASLHRFEYVHVPKPARVPTTQPPFSQEMRDALLAIVPRKKREEHEDVIYEQPRIGDGELRVGDEVGVGVLIAMPRPTGEKDGNNAGQAWGEGEGLEAAGEISLGVLECKAI